MTIPESTLIFPRQEEGFVFCFVFCFFNLFPQFSQGWEDTTPECHRLCSLKHSKTNEWMNKQTNKNLLIDQKGKEMVKHEFVLCWVLSHICFSFTVSSFSLYSYCLQNLFKKYFSLFFSFSQFYRLITMMMIVIIIVIISSIIIRIIIFS